MVPLAISAPRCASLIDRGPSKSKSRSTVNTINTPLAFRPAVSSSLHAFIGLHSYEPVRFLARFGRRRGYLQSQCSRSSSPWPSIAQQPSTGHRMFAGALAMLVSPARTTAVDGPAGPAHFVFGQPGRYHVKAATIRTYGDADLTSNLVPPPSRPA
jgi:hypothetical protein